MNTRISRTIGAVAAAAAILGGLTACDQAKDTAESATSAAGDAAGQATSAAGDAAGQATSKAGDAAGQATSKAGEAVGGAGGSGSEAKPPVPSTKIATPGGDEVTLSDQAIIAEYAKYGYEKGHLGAPLGPVSPLPDGEGKYLTLKGGTIYSSEASGAHVVHGAIGDAWGKEGHEAGKLGYPTSDETAEDGGIKQTFEKGEITFKDGKTTIS